MHGASLGGKGFLQREEFSLAGKALTYDGEHG